MTTIRHFRQVVLWPLQLMPIKPGVPVQRHWEVLEDPSAGNPWRELRDELNAESREIRERYYKEFVTFLPYVQRFIYGSSWRAKRPRAAQVSGAYACFAARTCCASA